MDRWVCVPHVISWEVAVNQSELWDAVSQIKAWIFFYKAILNSKVTSKQVYEYIYTYKHDL